MIKLLQHNFVKMMTWAVDSAISGVRITLSWWYITIIIEIIIMRVTRMMWKRSLSSCSFRPQAKLRKMTQLQRKKNPIKTKHKEDEAAGPWTFSLAYYLLVSRHITEPNDLKQFLSLINLSSPRPCCQFDDCSTEACWQHFVFIILFWLGKIRLRCDVAVLHLGIFWPIFHFKECVFSCPGQLNSDGDLDWIAFAILAMFVFLRGNCFFVGVSGSSENWTNRFSQGSKFLVHGAHWCNIKHVF